MPELAADPRFVDHRARGRQHDRDRHDHRGLDGTLPRGGAARQAARRRACPQAWCTSRRTCSRTRISSARRSIETVKDGRHGELTMQAVVPRLSETPGDHPLGGPRARRRHRRRARRSLLGAHRPTPWRPCGDGRAGASSVNGAGEARPWRWPTSRTSETSSGGSPAASRSSPPPSTARRSAPRPAR